MKAYINASEFIKLGRDEFSKVYNKKLESLRLMGKDVDLLWFDIINDIGEGYEFLGDCDVRSVAGDVYVGHNKRGKSYDKTQYIVPCTYNLQGVQLKEVQVMCNSYDLNERILYFRQNLFSDSNSNINNVILNDSCVIDITASSVDMGYITVNKIKDDEDIIIVALEKYDSHPLNEIVVNSDMIAITHKYTIGCPYFVIKNEDIVKHIFKLLNKDINNTYTEHRCIRFGANYLRFGVSTSDITQDEIDNMRRLPLKIKKELIKICNDTYMENKGKIRRV